MLKTIAMPAPGARAVITAGLAGMLLVLGACSSDPAAPAPAEATPGAVPGLAITNARLILAPVSGNPAAVYFDLAYEGDKGLTIRKAEVEGAGMTMMHDYGEHDYKVQMMEALPVGIKKGSAVSFKPGGLHLMAMEPSADWAPGGTVKVTLTLSGGTTHVFDAEIRSAGDER